MPAILWMGPVMAQNLKSVPLPAGWSIFTIGDVVRPPDRPREAGIVPADFRAWASSALAGPDKLGALLRRAKAESAILASFSAGHGLLEILLASAPGDRRILGTLAADSYYGLALKPGYLAHAQACAENGDPFWLTTSGSKGGTTTHSGSESVGPLAAALELAPVRPPREMPAPLTARGRGGVLWLDYGAQYAHVKHATELAPRALSAWLAGVGNDSGPGGGSGLAVAICAAAVAWAAS